MINPKGGFTLIEVLIYSALLALFLSGALVFVSGVLGSADRLLERNELLSNQELVDRRVRSILNQQNGQVATITSPAPNSSSTSQLGIINHYGKSIVLYTEGSGQLGLTAEDGRSELLTNNRVKVSQFLIEHFSNTQSSSSIKISFMLQSAFYNDLNISSTLYYSLYE